MVDQGGEGTGGGAGAAEDGDARLGKGLGTTYY